MKRHPVSCLTRDGPVPVATAYQDADTFLVILEKPPPTSLLRIELPTGPITVGIVLEPLPDIVRLLTEKHRDGLVRDALLAIVSPRRAVARR